MHFQKYCHYLITVACVRQTLFESTKPKQQFTHGGKQNTPDDRANVITGTFIAHLRDLLFSFLSLLGSPQSHDRLNSMGDKKRELCVLVYVGYMDEVCRPFSSHDSKTEH